MVDSAPSRPKRFWPIHLVARNFSMASAAFMRSRMWRCSVGSSLVEAPSTCSWIQRFSSIEEMWVYSMPDVRQYASRNTPRMSPSFMRSLPPTGAYTPASKPVRNSRSLSQIVRP